MKQLDPVASAFCVGLECVHVCGSWRLMPGIILSHSSTLFNEAESLSQTQSSLIWLRPIDSLL